MCPAPGLDSSLPQHLGENEPLSECFTNPRGMSGDNGTAGLKPGCLTHRSELFITSRWGGLISPRQSWREGFLEEVTW